MTMSYFELLVLLVVLLLILNIANRFVFMRFLKSLPQNQSETTINDLLDSKGFERLLRNMTPEQQAKANNIRSWLIRIIISMAVVILLILIIGILSFIK